MNERMRYNPPTVFVGAHSGCAAAASCSAVPAPWLPPRATPRSTARGFSGVSNFPVSVCLNRFETRRAFAGRFQENAITTSINTSATNTSATSTSAATVSFASLGLTPELLRAIADQGYTETTPIQAKAIPEVLAGRDLLAAAQTGTGKTAGFTLPMLQRLSQSKLQSSNPNAKHPRILVLVPTRELAAQVQASIRTYGKYMKLRSVVIFGGVSINTQISDLRRGVDIVVATPGRLLDHVGQKTIDLRHIEVLVLDEADRMLDMGFIPDIRRIIALLPAKRQNLLFSATFSEEIRRLASGFLHSPAVVEVARRNTTAELVTQVVHPVAKDRKRALLSHLVKTGDWAQVLVFTKTKHGANRLAEQLEKDGIEADAIHGNKSQNARTRALARFKNNELRVLVATDIAARGLDIEDLPHVVNFDLPNVPEDYVHRIGRTGRAGASGAALSLVSREDRPLLTAIERVINRRLPQEIVIGFEPGSVGPMDEPDDRPARAPQRRPQGRPQGARPGQRNGAPSRADGNGSRNGNASRNNNGSRDNGSRTGKPRREDQPQREARPARDSQPSRPSGNQPSAASSVSKPAASKSAPSGGLRSAMNALLGRKAA